MYVLEVKELTKSFGKIKAVDHISFNVPEGSVFGLIGRNGAGKTTTIRMMMNIYLPDSGEVILQGTKIGQEFKDKAGYLPEERGLYKKMKVWDTLLYFAELKGKTGREVEKKANYYLKKFELYDRKNSKIEDLSKGNQQKIQFITTILHDPEFLILDEPFSGLDPINTDLLKEIILELKSQRKIIILSTHLMDFAERLCDHIALIERGRLIFEGPLNDIKARFAKRNIQISCEEDLAFLKEAGIAESVVNSGNEKSIKLKSDVDPQELLKVLIQRNIVIKKYAADEISLHEIFIEATGEEKRLSAEEANV
ncbi:MAG: ATP-binding cassette domain-containing protein [Ignavibacteriaceae bacterium]|nr:ATP-binding cassette domain-containing protein [Ignavibacteriaceae bacterium]